MELFTRYGSPSKEGEMYIRGWLMRPDTLDTAERIAWYDERAGRLIRECQEAIAALIEYRQQLQRRYAQLETMSYVERLEFTRRKWDKVTYTIRVIRRYSDGTEVATYEHIYPGQERHIAFRGWKALKQSRPGIEAVEKI